MTRTARITESIIQVGLQVLCWFHIDSFVILYAVIGLITIVYSILTLLIYKYIPPLGAIIVEVLICIGWVIAALVIGLTGWNTGVIFYVPLVLNVLAGIFALVHFFYLAVLLIDMLTLKKRRLLRDDEGFTTRGLLRVGCRKYIITIPPKPRRRRKGYSSSGDGTGGGGGGGGDGGYGGGGDGGDGGGGGGGGGGGDGGC